MAKLLLLSILIPFGANGFLLNSNSSMEPIRRSRSAMADDDCFYHVEAHQKYDSSLFEATKLDEGIDEWIDQGKIPNQWNQEVLEGDIIIDSFSLVDKAGARVLWGKGEPANVVDGKADGIVVKYKMQVGAKSTTTETKIEHAVLMEMSAGVEGVMGAGTFYQVLAGASVGAKTEAKITLENGFRAAIVAEVTADARALMLDGTLGVSGSAKAIAEANVAFKVDLAKGSFAAGGEVFAGFKADGKVHMRWFNLKGSAKFGAGATCEAKCEHGVISFKAGAAVGPGLDGGFEICVGQIAEDVVAAIDAAPAAASAAASKAKSFAGYTAAAATKAIIFAPKAFGVLSPPGMRVFAPHMGFI